MLIDCRFILKQIKWFSINLLIKLVWIKLVKKFKITL